MHESRSDSRNEIEQKELLCSPHSLQHASEYKKRPHVEEYMREASMHEQMCERLPHPEEWRCREVQCKVLHHELLVQRNHNHHQNVDYDDIFNCYR